MTLPNLVYVGADKAGSSWYFEVLSRHPDVFVTPSKDLYFFDRYFDRGLGWYERRFEGAKPTHRYVCELSHDYMYADSALERIAAALPEVRLLVSARRPLDRMTSEFKYLQRKGFLDGTASFVDAIERYPEALVARSLYADRVELCQALFGHDRVHVFDFSLLERSAADFQRQLMHVLDLPYIPDLVVADRVNPGSRPRQFTPAKMVTTVSRLLRDAGHDRLLGHLKRSTLVQRTLFGADVRRDVDVGATLDSHLSEKFLADAAALGSLTGYDYVASWYEGPPPGGSR